jgi:hypothetical protein
MDGFRQRKSLQLNQYQQHVVTLWLPSSASEGDFGWGLGRLPYVRAVILAYTNWIGT